MKKLLMSCTFLGGALLLLTGMTSSLNNQLSPKVDPAVLWEHITKVSPYTRWSFWPDHEGFQPGKAPHAPLHRIYVNGVALGSSRPPLRYGAIVVKENYSKDRELRSLTVMYKVQGYNPSGGDWFWVKYTPDGRAERFGRLADCIRCHSSRAENDYLFVHEFERP